MRTMCSIVVLFCGNNLCPFDTHPTVPSMYREQIVMELHAGALGGHLAADKTHSRLKEQFYWPGYWTDIQLYCQASVLAVPLGRPLP